MSGSGFKSFAVAALTASVALLPGVAFAESAGKPANICKELVAFLHPPAAPAAPNPAPAQSSTAVSGPSSSGSQKPAADGETQKNSGLSGPTSSSGPGAAGPQGTSQNANAPSGASAQAPAPAAAPAAPAAPPPKTPSAAFIEQGDAVAGANDIPGCQRVARQIRRDGVVMPAPLMALAALDLKYLEAAQ